MNFVGAGLSVAATLGLRIFQGVPLLQTSLPLIAALTVVAGGLSLLMGLLAEVLVRTYFESQRKSTYLVERTWNFDGDVPSVRYPQARSA
ncbi:MAG: hypothetical protein QM775_11340 [Pirellulales bacterium]